MADGTYTSVLRTKNSVLIDACINIYDTSFIMWEKNLEGIIKDKLLKTETAYADYVISINALLYQRTRLDINQEQFKKLHYRMYENKFPKENELVFVSFNYILILINNNSAK